MTTRENKERRAVQVLTGASAGEMLTLALGDRAILRSWRLHAVNHRPGAGVSAGYSVIWDRLEGADGDSRVRKDSYLVASTARISQAHLDAVSAVTLYADDLAVHVWEFPLDPELPALETACDPERLSAVLGELVDVELLGYRPTRRAVLRAEGASGRHYVKVLRPEALPALVQRHAACQDAGLPTPLIEVSTPDGLVVISAVVGSPLGLTYQHGRHAEATFESLARTLDALPTSALHLQHRLAWAERCELYARAASAAMPEISERATALAEGIRQVRQCADYGPLVPTHGDFYEANVLVSAETGRVSGLLDLDSFGPGHRADDWGCLLGHLSVLPSLSEKYRFVPTIRDDWFARASRHADAAAIAASAAGVVLSLVASARQRGKTNWKKHALARLVVAERWLETARG